jgi:threonine/homoserine/homoserine lactone efflux protein
VLVLGLLFVLLGLVSDSLYALAAGTVGGLIRRRRTALRYGSGAVYIGLGALAAFARRT